MIKTTLISSKLDIERAQVSAGKFREEINASLNGEELVFVPKEEIKDDLCKFIFVASGGSEPEFLKILKETKGPFILITTQGDNSLPAAMEILSYINDKGEHGEILHGTAAAIAAKILSIHRCFSVISKLDGYHAGVLGSPNMLINSEYDTKELERTSGIKTTYLSMDEVCKEIDKKTYEPDKYTEELINTGYNRNELEKAFWIYGAVCRLIDKYGFNAISLRCFDLLEPYKASGCLALAILNSRGIPASCEGDTRSLLSMIVINTLTGEPCFMANPSRIDMEKKEIVLAHCTLPLSMVGKYTLNTHFESGISVAVKGEFSPGSYTLFKCREDMKTYFVQKAEFVENLSECNLCRTQIKLKVDDVESYMTHPLSNHQVLVRGNWVDEVKELFRWYEVRNS